MRVVLDTSVLVAAWRSRNGASFALLQELRLGSFEIAVSVPLVLEYEDVLLRFLPPGLSVSDVGYFVDYLCQVAVRQSIFFLWRPFLRDPKDDMVVEVAVAARCTGIVTHNIRDFQRIESLGLRLFTPGEFLMSIGERS
ncbi:MAG: putative toxin-antitoxin system toxin component, PIN family [Polyangiaceae bacterium]